MTPAATATLESDVLAAARGDRTAFGRLVSTTSALVSAIALAEVRDLEASRDIAQDVYLHIWNDLGRLRDPASFLPWLRQITRRQARRVAARRARQVHGPEAERAVGEAPARGPGPGETALQVEQVGAVREALEALPDETRETLLLYYREGHSAAQVARLLGLQEAAVHQRLSRARARLREDLLARLGEVVARTAPGAAFTAAVVGALAPRAAAAGAAAGMLAKLGGAQGAAATLAAVAGLLVLALAIHGRWSPEEAAPAPAVARPAGRVPLAESGPATPPLPALAAEPDGALVITVTVGGQPAAGAKARVYALLPVEPGTGRPAWRLAWERPVDASGSARVPVAAGAYLVSARAPGLAPAQVEVVRATGEREARATLALVPPVSLAGQTISREDGAGLPLVALALTRERSVGGARATAPLEEQAGAVSDASGRFVFGALAPGRYTLEAEAPGRGRVRMTGVEVPRDGLLVRLASAGRIMGFVVDADGKPVPGAEVRFSGGQEILAVESGPSGGFVAEVDPGPYAISARGGDAVAWLDGTVAVASGSEVTGLVLRLGSASSIVGRLHTPEDAPIGGALLSLSPGGAGGEVARVLTDADGTFRLSPVAPGVYDLRALAQGFSPARWDGLTVLPGQTYRADLGTYATGAVAGTVTDVAGRPMPGVRVRGGKRWGAGFGQVEGEAVTGADGRYRLDGLGQGVARVRARVEGQPLGPTRDVMVEAGQVASADLTLADAGTLQVTVTEGDGDATPAGPVRIRIRNESSAWSARDIADLPAHASGRARFELPAGAYRVSALRAEDGPVWFARAPGAVEVRAGTVSEVSVRLEPAEERPGALSIQVVELGGAPSRGATAMVLSGSSKAYLAMDEEGTTELVRFRPDSDATVLARNEGRASLPVVVRPEQRTVRLELRPAATLRGRVLASDGRAPGEFRLTLDVPAEESIGGGVGREFSGDRFEVRDAPAGHVVVTVITPDGRSAAAELDLAPGQVLDQDLLLHASARVTVRPVDGSGRPVAGAYLLWGARMVDASPSGAAYEAAAVRDGRLTMTDLPAGPRTLRIGARVHREVVREVDLAPGQALDLGEVTLESVPDAALH